MTDALVEAVARTAASVNGFLFSGDSIIEHAKINSRAAKFVAGASAALAAIEASGTHVVVPVEPTDVMLDAAEPTHGSRACWNAMLAARPTQEDAGK